MGQQMDQKLDCKKCGTIYLDIPETVDRNTPIHCSTCGVLLGRWGELEANFAAQGGENGVFKMDEGQIIPIAEGPKPLS